MADNDTDKDPKDESPEANGAQQAPADALSRTPEDLEEEAEAHATESGTDAHADEEKISPLKRFFRRVNVYFLGFLLIVIVATVIAVVTYLNSQKAPPEVAIANQSLNEETLRELANTDASVGSNSQTLTIQGNAVIAGQTLMRGNLNIAGNLQTGGTIQAPSLTISGESNLGTAQINTLQVASDVAIEGTTTMRDISVSGGANFSGSVTASQITTSRLVLSGNATLEIPNHISFTGPAPSRTLGGGIGNGGSASISGSDTSGTVNIGTGNNPSAGCLVRVGFQQAFPSQPRVMISPVNPAAGRTQYYVERDTSGFSICAASPAPANQRFAYDYFVTY